MFRFGEPTYLYLLLLLPFLAASFWHTAYSNTRFYLPPFLRCCTKTYRLITHSVFI